MRSEATILALLLGNAERDEQIRAVILSGSRTNPAALRDIFQDYDIVCVVDDVAPFTADPTWIARSGELTILQTPEEMLEPPRQGSRREWPDLSP